MASSTTAAPGDSTRWQRRKARGASIAGVGTRRVQVRALPIERVPEELSLVPCCSPVRVPSFVCLTAKDYRFGTYSRSSLEQACRR